ncbi:enoyl-ACP reductase [Bermanella marisrubri]|uniref:Enoyl-[acyl-carrier-protein] reductase [NADH] n=1 Tax=Bermanella marisrubri TaxID=207949 RepID=Q1MXL0_9GAMM|nr:enoyl-ACP reductase [Bermanella marisrubri]EAT10703.1 Short-chain dehydrogenase/reductase SDR [Oceanobacter sp. RED65] [Bermanella marisrubri]QIZ84241.1 enoyl-ACP reductase [Bermanella marisrubri]
MQLLEGKTALIVGLASNKSIAYGIAKQYHQAGASLIFTYQNERLRSRVEKFAEEFSANAIYPCDLSNDQELLDLKTSLESTRHKIDIVVHSVGFAPGEELDGKMVDVCTRNGFKIAHEISSYSLIALTQSIRNMLSESASILTLTYHGSQQTLPNYNVMGLAKASLEAAVRYLANDLGEHGIRVNAISAGPIRTLAASGIKSFRSMLAINEKRSALKRNINIDDVGKAAVFLGSDLSSGVTAETIYVDGGFRSCAISRNEM